jgi:hypothetical protein
MMHFISHCYDFLVFTIFHKPPIEMKLVANKQNYILIVRENQQLVLGHNWQWEWKWSENKTNMKFEFQRLDESWHSC